MSKNTLDQREKTLEKLCDHIVNGMSMRDLTRIVWDQIFDELQGLSSEDLDLYLEDYGVEL